ncbi:sulfotransferase family protein [Nocardioides sp. Kera G14]|uniref:sulfotransferase family protein n=1 Tax=Nocardioides sp. Kera G14 TaxID=2884264 RepID=UPI001D10C131|nr:sulfotransferase [Nocardioides sp. Kera G14]UDY22776.1 sulfotransferase [Nocardioides sp. Kera G14]
MRTARPDFMIIGAPKAGTTALHAALARHPEVAMSVPKEPKYWLCDDAPPPAYNGPGDAHSQQEWIWRRREYDALFSGMPEDRVRGESTPFYLWSRQAREAIATALPDVKLIAVVRDPIDRAYSNWMHLWCDGLEPVGDFVTAFQLQEERAARGWAPFWRYEGLGLYGRQLEHLQRLIDPEQILVLRYRQLIDDPCGTVDRACEFLGIATGHLGEVPADNSRSFVEPGWRPNVFGPVIRAGAWLGQFAPPEVWRSAEPRLRPLLRSSDDAKRPRLTPEQRAALLPAFAEDIELLAKLTGDDYSAWLSAEARGSFSERRK